MLATGCRQATSRVSRAAVAPGGRGLSVAATLLSLIAVAACSADGGGAAAVKASSSLDIVGVTTYSSAGRQAAPVLVGATLDGESLSLEGVGRGKMGDE